MSFTARRRPAAPRNAGELHRQTDGFVVGLMPRGSLSKTRSRSLLTGDSPVLKKRA